MDDPSSRAAVTSTLLVQVMIASIIVTLFVVVLLSFLYFYARRWSGHEDPTIVSWRRRAGRQAAAQRRGLEPSALQSLPVVEYDLKDFKDGLECAVCLSELSQGEKLRVLPKCNHGFHVDCIDVWFKSHPTCPLCRTPVNLISAQNPSSLNPNDVSEMQEVRISLPVNGQNLAFPTNVLYWGDETEVRSVEMCLEEGHEVSSMASTSRDQGLAMEVPTRICEDCLCSPLEEETSPVMNKLRSLKRLLSRGKGAAMVSSPRASSSGDVAQVYMLN